MKQLRSALRDLNASMDAEEDEVDELEAKFKL